MALMRSFVLVVFGFSLCPIITEASSDWKPRPPLASTFSIVALDPATGELGVAVQSHWFSVGSLVPWAE